MKIRYVSRKCTAYQDTKNYTEKKLKKLDKFFPEDCEVTVDYTLERDNRHKVEVTAENSGLIFRAQSTTDDFKYSVDEIVEILTRQIRRHKTKLEKRIKKPIDSEILESSDFAEDDYDIIKTKKIDPKPMTDEEAILQMNLLAHDFFIYTDSENKPRIIYRRRDGKYGLIEVE